MYQLEICAFNIGSALTAGQYGAHRVELCDNPLEGGTTPSYGLIKFAREKLHIDVYPIIRPRGGDFLYSDEEFNVMKKDIQLCKELGCNGVVTGILTSNGTIDIKRCGQLAELAYPMGVTFHRAFDRAADPFQALEDIIQTGCERILTSGQQPAVIHGLPLLKELVQRAEDRIVIMPGAGLTSENLREVANYSGAMEFHTTAKKWAGTNMAFKNENLEETEQHVVCDGDEVKKLIDVLMSLKRIAVQ